MLAAESNDERKAAANGPGRDAAQAWKLIAGPVEPFLQAASQRLIAQVQAFDQEIANYAAYALTGQGKQIRPVLVALSGGASGQLNDKHITAAVIIEMVHLATLVHDDVIDEAGIRRNRPTLAAQWGNEISVLLGDCLFAHALILAASFPTTEVCRAVSAATNTVCAGEIIQTKRRRNFQFTQAEYFKVLEMKTGELFGLSCDQGAFVSGSTPEVRADLRRYGLALGTAYQIYDDCIDLFGSETTEGKSLGTDLAKGKLTLPMLLLLERATDAEKAQVQEMILNWQPAHFEPVIALLRRYETLNASRETITLFLRQARKCLENLPETESRAALLNVTHFLAQQTGALGVSSSQG
jgi:octaprenyl-diphosphate synthase